MHGTAPVTYGGYSNSVVLHESAVLGIPSNFDLAAAAPVLYAGITTYSPLKRNGLMIPVRWRGLTARR